MSWIEAPENVTVPKGELHLWRWSARANAAWGLALNVAEKDRIDRLRHAADRQAARQARLGLRWVLSRYLGQAESLHFLTGPHGKPALPGDPLFFNLSHSRDWVGLLVGSRPVGLDIEWIRPRAAMDHLAQKIFTDREWQAWSAAADRLVAFYQGWTRKEAFFKAIGDGISYGFHQAEIDVLGAEWAKVQLFKPATCQWWVCPLVWEPGYAAALSTDQAHLPISFYQVELENEKPASRP